MLDLRTLFFVATVAAGSVGLLLVYTWLQNRRDRSLLYWSVGYGLFAGGLGIIALREPLPWVIGFALANAMLVAGYSFAWAGVRVFDGRSIPWVPTIGGPVFCAVAYLLPDIGEDYRARAFIVAGLATAFSLAMAVDLWRGRRDGLRTRPVLIVAIAINGAANAVRALYALTLTADHDMLKTSQTVTAVSTLVSLLALIAANLLMMAMSKERAAAEMRRLAQMDTLTGAMTRGRFYTAFDRMTAAAHAGGTPMAMVLFDLDGFKAINDGAGHAVGDALLRRFAETVHGALPKHGAFGRIGGEEFAVAIAGGEEAAVRFAETVRLAFAEAAAGTALDRPTVSAGVAALMFGDDADSLTARTDKALYAAKAAGRNQVARAPALNR
jgi:diguanylate cyclase (GGDEF)-like protein